MKNSLLRRWTAAKMAVVLAIGLCACGGAGARTDAESTSSMPTTSAAAPKSATPSPSPTRTGPLTTGPGVLPGEKPPVKSSLALSHDQAGGYAFAAYFMHALSWSIATNDAWLIAQVSAPTCRACKSYMDAVTALHKNGQTQRGGRPTIRSSHRLLGKLPYEAEVGIEYIVDESPAILLPSKRSLPAHLGVHSIVYLVWSAGGWLVREQAAP